MTLDHITITVADYAASRAFYESALGAIGLRPLYEEKDVVTGFGADRPTFWVGASDATHPVSRNAHVAFRCDSQESVRAFHEAAMAAGGRDNGAPGPRPQYHERYYAAFVLDPDGNNIEAVFGNF